MTLLSPILAAVAELVADTAVCAIVPLDTIGNRRIRSVEPAGKLGLDLGDSRGVGFYVPFVIVSQLDAPWQAGTATSAVAIGLRCYAASYPAAEALALACAAVFHRKAGRIAASRLGIYSSHTEGGPTLDKDPDTGQPLAHVLVTLNVSIQAIPV